MSHPAACRFVQASLKPCDWRRFSERLIKHRPLASQTLLRGNWLWCDLCAARQEQRWLFHSCKPDYIGVRGRAGFVNRIFRPMGYNCGRRSPRSAKGLGNPIQAALARRREWPTMPAPLQPSTSLCAQARAGCRRSQGTPITYLPMKSPVLLACQGQEGLARSASGEILCSLFLPLSQEAGHAHFCFWAAVTSNVGISRVGLGSFLHPGKTWM